METAHNWKSKNTISEESKGGKSKSRGGIEAIKKITPTKTGKMGNLGGKRLSQVFNQTGWWATESKKKKERKVTENWRSYERMVERKGG